MKRDDFYKLIDELLEVDPGTIGAGAVLEAHGWDSLSVVGFLALADEHFGIRVAPGKLAECQTVEDLVALVGEQVAA
jgi:acyl carrier protein